MTTEPARRNFRVLSRRRDGYDGGTLFDVQLQYADTGELAWAQTFTDEEQAAAFEARLDTDLSELGDAEFRRKHGVPAAPS